MSSITNGWLPLIALIATITLLLLAVVFVVAVVVLAKINGLARRPQASAARVDPATASAMNTMVEGLKTENASLQSLLLQEQAAREDLQTRVETAERSASAAASVTREQVRLGVDQSSAAAITELQDKLRGVELHNLALHQECADLRARLAKGVKGVANRDADITEAEDWVDRATARLLAAQAERDAALREVDDLKLEMLKLRAEISTLLARPTEPAAEDAAKAAPTSKGTPLSWKASPLESKLPPKLPLKSTPKAAPKPPIVTRTTATKTSGVGVFDDEDKQWNAAEDAALLNAYLTTRNLSATAETLRVDQKQVALRLISLLLAPQGIVDDPSAPKHGKTYSGADSKAIAQAWRDGRKLPAIARDFQRDQLGIGWKLLDHASRPVELTADMIPEIVEGAHR